MSLLDQINLALKAAKLSAKSASTAELKIHKERISRSTRRMQRDELKATVGEAMDPTGIARFTVKNYPR